MAFKFTPAFIRLLWQPVVSKKIVLKHDTASKHVSRYQNPLEKHHRTSIALADALAVLAFKVLSAANGGRHD